MSRRGSQQGAALVIALVLLAIVTLLATSGMRMSIAELWMAGNEQFHRKAVDAASAGIEASIARFRAQGVVTASPVDGSGAVAIGEPASDSYSVSARYTGREASLPGSSAGDFFGEHFEIESTGTSARGARDVQIQGLMVVSTSNGVANFSRIGAGLAVEGEP
jgi:type II secretory pathway component PulK